jgi:hypothetical protein
MRDHAGAIGATQVCVHVSKCSCEGAAALEIKQYSYKKVCLTSDDLLTQWYTSSGHVLLLIAWVSKYFTQCHFGAAAVEAFRACQRRAHSFMTSLCETFVVGVFGVVALATMDLSPEKELGPSTFAVAAASSC